MCVILHEFKMAYKKQFFLNTYDLFTYQLRSGSTICFFAFITSSMTTRAAGICRQIIHFHFLLSLKLTNRSQERQTPNELEN